MKANGPILNKAKEKTPHLLTQMPTLDQHFFIGEISQNCENKKEIMKGLCNFKAIKNIVVTYSQFDSNIRVFYVFLGFLKNILKYFIQRPIFKPLYFYNDFF